MKNINTKIEMLSYNGFDTWTETLIVINQK